jgi:hypothetical protein
LETYVFEAVQVLVPLSAHLTLEGLLLLHAQSTRIRGAGLGIDDGEGTVAVLMQLLRRVAVGLVVPTVIVVNTHPRITISWVGMERVKLT